ncbi:MAG: NAD(P)H-hydrate dehydratase [Oscillospiraceae bacterium]|nr:NAD(P)H-hydrate dehydratase [Oscillospiraceae bacterium]
MTELTRELISSWLPNRPEDGHKGTFGKVLIVGGSVGFSGAPVLAAKAAVRGGTGLVFVGIPQSLWQVAAVKLDEAMPFPLPEDGEGKLDYPAMAPILRKLSGCDAGLIGPGLGQSGALDFLVTETLQNAVCPMVADADGLNALSRHMDRLSQIKTPLILTPHDGEYARLAGHLPGKDRVSEAAEFAQAHGCILVLKGHRTVIAAPDGEIFVNTTGNHGMAKGGSGDVLSGLILSLLGQGMEPVKAAAAAVWIHGRAGDYAAAEKGHRGMTPSDLIERLPKVWRDDFHT